MVKVKAVVNTKYGVCSGMHKVHLKANDVDPALRKCVISGNFRLSHEPVHSPMVPGDWWVTLFSPKPLPNGRNHNRKINEAVEIVSGFGVLPNMMALTTALDQRLDMTAVDLIGPNNMDIFFFALGTVCQSQKGNCNLYPYLQHALWMKERKKHPEFSLLAENATLPKWLIPVFLDKQMREKLEAEAV